MNLKERVINTFRGKPVDKIVFSPRIYYWYMKNKLYKRFNPSKNNKIPQKYFKKSQLDIHEMLNTSPRYCEETLFFDLLETRIKPEAEIQIKTKRGAKKDEIVKDYITPIGNLREVSSIGGGLGGHLTEYPIKTIQDIKILEYILENTEVKFSNENFFKAEGLFGDMGVVSTYLSHSPYQKLILEYMGFFRTILFLKRYPQKILDFMHFLSLWDDTMYEEIAHSPLKIINFGENIDANLSSPPYFKKYLIPYYEERVNQLKNAGKYCHIHMDGSIKDLLPFLSELPFDGYEALTPLPQGDVSLEEIKKAIGEKILLDGIPSILFLSEYSNNYLKKFAIKILNLFAPRLILGISDELSPNGDIRKVEFLSTIVEEYKME
ncbi:MAG: uroporphyrinogen decarboxylase family protein [Promethearchaeota archaeon]